MFSREKRLLRRLESGDAAFRTALAADETAPAAVLAVLATDSSVAVRTAVASNRATSESDLYRLGHDVERPVRAKALAGLLEARGFRSAKHALRSEAPAELIAVVAEDLLRYELDQLATRDPGDVGAHYWDLESKPRADVLAAMAKLRNRDARAAVAKSGYATPAILSSLAQDPDEKVRLGVAGNDVTPTHVLESLTRDPSSDVRGSALYLWVPRASVELRLDYAARPDLSYGLLRWLTDDPAPLVRRAALVSLAENPETPSKILRQAASDGEPEALRQLAQHRAPIVRKAAASSRRRPLDAFISLADDPAEEVRRHVAKVIESGYDRVYVDPLSEEGPRSSDRHSGPAFVPPSALAALAASPHAEIRRAVASHRQVPAAVLARLLDDRSVFVWALEERDDYSKNRPFSVLHESTWDDDEWRLLAGVANPEARSVVASHAPPGLLGPLVEDPDTSVRQAVLRNPAVPGPVVRRLMDDPSEDVANMASQVFQERNWRFLGDYHLFIDAPQTEARAVVGGDENAQAEWLAALAGDPDVAVRAAVAGNPNTPPHAFAILASNPEPLVVDAIVRSVDRSQIPPEALEALGASSSSEVRAAIAADERTPDETLAALISDPEEAVRLAAAANGFRWGTAFISAVMGDDWRKERGIGQESVPRLLALARDSALGAEALHSLAQSPFDEVRAAAASNPSVVAATLMNLTRDVKPSVRVIVAGSSNVSQDALAFLSEDKSPEVRRGVAANAKAGPAVLAMLDQDPDPDVAATVAAHPSTPPDSLAALIKQKRRGVFSQRVVRQAVAANPNTPTKTLAKLATDSDTAAFVAANPSTPSSILASLVSSADERVREAVASNPHTAREALELLAKDFSTLVKDAARKTLSTGNPS